VLKLTNSKFTFYTTSWLKLPNLMNKRVELLVNSEKVTFLDFLMGFYTFSFDLNIKEGNKIKNSIFKYIENSHQNQLTKEFFSAIFLATPISLELREKVIALGVSHLIALSGFHLGVLSLVLFFILKFPYSFLQNRYFPYRNKKVDLTIIISIILFFYLQLTNSPPSLIRAFIMMLIGFYLYYKNYEILSFKTLLIAVLIIIALFPKIVFSIGFWFSIAGVFYIYLFLHHFKHLSKWLIFILLHFWVYFMMMPVIHFVFLDFSYYQLFSPILSMLFIVFYPLEILLHLIGGGHLLDDLLLKLLSFEIEMYEIETSLEFLSFYIFISLLAIKYKKSIYILFAMTLLIPFH
ncbi:MAG: ComEC/Rec2 family competence protein, partial [Methanosarcinaceae archaeon]